MLDGLCCGLGFSSAFPYASLPSHQSSPHHQTVAVANGELKSFPCSKTLYVWWKEDIARDLETSTYGGGYSVVGILFHFYKLSGHLTANSRPAPPGGSSRDNDFPIPHSEVERYTSRTACKTKTKVTLNKQYSTVVGEVFLQVQVSRGSWAVFNSPSDRSDCARQLVTTWGTFYSFSPNSRTV